jgi:hypothetical protein
MGKTNPAGCGEAQGIILLQSLDHTATVNTYCCCTTLQHPKKVIMMKQTMSPNFFSAGTEQVVHCCKKCLNQSGSYVQKQMICPLFLVLLDTHIA